MNGGVHSQLKKLSQGHVYIFYAQSSYLSVYIIAALNPMCLNGQKTYLHSLETLQMMSHKILTFVRTFFRVILPFFTL